MLEQRDVAFLEQAYRDSWEQYCAALKPKAKVGWDVCILTASDERQAEMYRQQLAWRRSAGLLPVKTRFTVIADPHGSRIGSGGATLRVLASLSTEDDTLTAKRVLLMHSGGDSRRLPHCSATGQLFARVPRVLPDGRASTLFDEFLISLSGSSVGAPPGVLVASGDVLLVFDHLQLSFQRKGAIGVAAAAPLKTGTRHGVYVPGDKGARVHAFLHKPDETKLREWSAVLDDGQVLIDTGLVWLDSQTALKMAALTQAEAVGLLCDRPPAQAGSLNFYGDVVLPLAHATEYEAYLADTSDGPATAEVRRAREVIWQRMRGTPLSCTRLRPAMFIHFGTSQEYWATVASESQAQGNQVRKVCGWSMDAAAFKEPQDNRLALINSAVESPEVSGENAALIIDSRISGALRWRGAALLANVCSSAPIELGANVVVHQLPLQDGYVTRVYGLADDPKKSAGSPQGAFMGRPWSQWCECMSIAPQELWPDIPEDRRSLWNAKLYPICPAREDSLRMIMPLQALSAPTADWLDAWRKAKRVSLAESFVVALSNEILSDIQAIEDYTAARRYCAAIAAGVPSLASRTLLGAHAGSLPPRILQVQKWLETADEFVRLRGYKALSDLSENGSYEERAFAVLAALMQRGAAAVQRRAAAPARRVPSAVSVRTAARLDFGGGWTDTPPYSLECGGTVLNAAVTLRGEYPIQVEAALLSEPKIILESRDVGATLEPTHVGELLSYRDPSDAFALLKVAMELRGIIDSSLDPELPVADLCRRLGSGLKLTTHTCIPRGSGLGASSIVAGAVLRALASLHGENPTPAELFDAVLCLEQMLTTGGGWQDQVGGLLGGIKLTTSQPGVRQELKVETVRVRENVRAELSSRLVLMYTGRQRLARDLLRRVMGRWMARDGEMVEIQRTIAALALKMRDALMAGDISAFGSLLGDHWACNKRMDESCTNAFIDGLFDTVAPYSNGGKLAGAGGGGFAFVIAHSAEKAQELRAVLQRKYRGTPVEVWECAIPEAGMIIDRRE